MDSPSKDETVGKMVLGATTIVPLEKLLTEEELLKLTNAKLDSLYEKTFQKTSPSKIRTKKQYIAALLGHVKEIHLEQLRHDQQEEAQKNELYPAFHIGDVICGHDSVLRTWTFYFIFGITSAGSLQTRELEKNSKVIVSNPSHHKARVWLEDFDMYELLVRSMDGLNTFAEGINAENRVTFRKRKDGYGWKNIRIQEKYDPKKEYFDESYY